MRSAPPVQVPVGRFVWGPLGMVLLASLAAAAWGHVAHVSLQDDGPKVLLALSGLVLVLLSCWLLRHDALPQGHLCWDGEAWFYQAGQGVAVPAAVTVLCDLGTVMLVEVGVSQGPCRGRRFCGLRAADMPALWHGWRCAVFGRDIL